MTLSCPNHSQLKLRLLKRPPYTASRRVGIDGTRDCDHYDYYRCPGCGTNYAAPKTLATPLALHKDAEGGDA